MNPTGKRSAAWATGVLVALIVFALEASLAPHALAATSSEGSSPAEDVPPECGDPAINSAPAMVACDNGGEGATSCETKTTIGVGGFGSVSGCGISCNTGWYACCQDPTLTRLAQCTCQPDRPRGPWTPEVVW